MAQDAAHDLAHLDRVWLTCVDIAQTLPVDTVPLMAAAYLHDLVNLPKDAPNRAQASALSARAAQPHLRALGLSSAQIAQACHAITAHSFSAGIEPESDTARILRDADRLDALGAIGIARSFAVSGQLGRSFYDPQDPFATTRDPDDTLFALDHWPIKLLRLPDGMLTDRGRAIAQERVLRMRDFLAHFASEIGAPPPTHWS
ncbi:MAG: hydrolase [Rhodobacteraceae bacterium]|nr:hydrolase [Paracoccaceae bacterium]MBT26705.1 hydrolase [Paracoccaceae bacterium]